MTNPSPYRLTVAEAADGFRRLSSVLATLPKIEERQVWFWDRPRFRQDGWRVMGGWPRSSACRLKPDAT